MMPDLFTQNTTLLLRQNPELGESVLAHSPNPACQTVPSGSGYPTLLHMDPASGCRYIHSFENPIHEADKLLNGCRFSDREMTILMGFGLGYLPLAILRRMTPQHRLIVVETSLDILFHALTTVDLAPFFSDPRVRLISPGQLNQLWDIFEKERVELAAGTVNKLIHPVSYEIFRSQYDRVEAKIEQIVSAVKNTYRFVESRSEFVLENIFRNILGLTGAAHIDALFGQVRNRPVLIVAAGPSLDKNIHRISEIKNSFPIIAVDSALKPLLGRGILPDVLVSIDPIPQNFKKLEGIEKEIFDQIPLVFCLNTCHEIPPLFEGARFIFNEHNPLSRWTVDLFGRIAEFPYGFSVAHYAFYLAREMGADPIIFVGLDLAFTPVRNHAAGAAIHWDPGRLMAQAVFVEGSHFQEVPSCRALVNILTLFEREIARTDACCIDATEGGARIQGTRIMPLSEVIDKWKDTGETTDFSSRFNNLWRSHRIVKETAAKDGLKWLMDEAAAVRADCQTGVSSVQNLLAELDKNGTDVLKTLIAVNRIADAVARHDRYLELTNDWLRGLAVEKNRLSQSITQVSDERSRQKAEARFSLRFFEQVLKISDQILQAGLPVLRQMAAVHDPS